jgi:hypothetical protein
MDRVEGSGMTYAALCAFAVGGGAGLLLGRHVDDWWWRGLGIRGPWSSEVEMRRDRSECADTDEKLVERDGEVGRYIPVSGGREAGHERR